MNPDPFLEIPLQTDSPSPIPSAPPIGPSARASTLRTHTWQTDIILAGTRFRVCLEDENSKLPLQRLHPSKPYILWRSNVRNLIAGGTSLKLALPPGGLTQWSDILQPNTASRNRLDPLDRLSATQLVTLYTNGQINIRCAEKSVLDTLWQIYFSKQAPETILQMRQMQHPVDIENYCLAQGMSASESAFAKETLTHQSQCFSLNIQQTLPSERILSSRYIRRVRYGYADDQFREPDW